MSKWDDLSLSEKATMMKVAIQNGITNIEDIRKEYNSFAEGGDKNEEETYYAGTLPMVPVIARRHMALPERNNSTWLRKRLYQNIEPRSYDDMASRISKALAGINTRTGEVTPEEDALWAYYMQQNPAEVSKYLELSPLQPTKGSTKYNTVVRYKKGISDEVLKKAVEKIPLGKNAQSSALFPDILAGLGDYTIGHGEDEYGKYVSIYDDWDLSTGAHNTGDMTLGIGTPFTVYDRRYYTDDDIKKAKGGNLFGDGGYAPSDAVKDRISKWEGKAMTEATIDPLSGKKVKKNNSFESEASAFVSALPESIREAVLSNPDLADNLYSYSYNVGAHNFKKRVVPALEKYYKGEGTIEDITKSMWATGDSKLRGLQRRREIEKQGVTDALTNAGQYIAQNKTVQPIYDESIFEYKAPVIDETLLQQPSTAVAEVYDPQKEARENLNRFASVMSMMDGGNNPYLSILNMASNPLAMIGQIGM